MFASFRFVLLKKLLKLLAEWEFRIGGVSRNHFLRRYLRYMNISHGNQVTVGVDVHIRNRGNLSLGERCGIGSFARIWNYAPITIGDDFLAAGGLTLNSSTHDPVTLEPRGMPIDIGNRVWCGVNVTILAGVTIGDDTVIGAGSVVANDIPSNSIAAGVPARKVKDLDRTSAPQIWRWSELP